MKKQLTEDKQDFEAYWQDYLIKTGGAELLEELKKSQKRVYKLEQVLEEINEVLRTLCGGR